MLFEDFDFNLLKDPNFKEDSVREELIAPLLKALGYSASPPNRIRRSVTLTHPFVYIGSKKHNITITPDYLVEKNGKKFFILDAKAPNEDVRDGKNVEQAYSYAMHPKIRVQYYGLCNGHDFVLYDVSREGVVLSFQLGEISSYIDHLSHLIGVKASMSRLDFRPDWGLYLMESRKAFAPDGKKFKQLHLSAKFHFVGRVTDELYSLQSVQTDEEGKEYLATFDFSSSLLPDLHSKMNSAELSRQIELCLKVSPFLWYDDDIRGDVSIVAEVGEGIFDNENEKYYPLTITNFF